VTYRWKGHSRSDKNLYRTKEEIDEWKSKEPIAKFMSLILEKNLLTQEELDSVQQQATDQIVSAVNESVKAKSAEPAGLEAAVFRAVL
jgi:pyruvate dehydrogenase E1 component alpha subunit